MNSKRDFLKQISGAFCVLPEVSYAETHGRPSCRPDAGQSRDVMPGMSRSAHHPAAAAQQGCLNKEVDKVIKWGAVVDGDDHDALVDYLSANFNPDQPPPYDPPRSAPQRTGAGKQSK